ncbi:MAG: hypothetical protein R3C12_07280 [Planctomycetaceae bacterium]
MTSSENERDPLEVLFSEYLDQFRRGAATSIEMFARQHEAQAEEIRELFPTLLALEQASRPTLDASSSQASEISSLISGGLQLGEYQLLREIGAGGMGIVYEAIQESMQRRVAVKVLPREFSKDPVRHALCRKPGWPPGCRFPISFQSLILENRADAAFLRCG